ncbi:MAG: tRNA (adenosine(37)-N6)-dimethylallyltransferase MiaA, partial [Dehalococcoidia bacterium]
REAMARVPHHVIGILDPDEPFNLALYLEQASQTVKDIWERGKVPFLVGGSGLYVWGLLEGLKVPHVPPDQKLREELELEARLKGSQALHQRLRRLDPTSANSIDPRNVRRTIRALEVCLKAEAPFSQLISKEGPTFPFLVIGLTAERERLYARIDRRVDEMMPQGFVDEVQGLIRREYRLDLPSMSGVGYKQIGRYLEGKLSLEEAIQQTKYETHRLARHQGAWFRADDQRIHWYDIADDFSRAVMEEVKAFCAVENGVRTRDEVH